MKATTKILNLEQTTCLGYIPNEYSKIRDEAELQQQELHTKITETSNSLASLFSNTTKCSRCLYQNLMRWRTCRKLERKFLHRSRKNRSVVKELEIQQTQMNQIDGKDDKD
ncbi:hypothetical protein ACEQPO_07765 [Bacillus sp. SL00103]